MPLNPSVFSNMAYKLYGGQKFAVCNPDDRFCKPNPAALWFKGISQDECKPVKSCCGPSASCSNQCECDGCIDFNNRKGFCTYDDLVKKHFVDCANDYIAEWKKPESIGRTVHKALNLLLDAAGSFGNKIPVIGSIVSGAAGPLKTLLTHIYAAQYGIYFTLYYMSLCTSICYETLYINR